MRPPRWLYPEASERKYLQLMKKMMEDSQQLTKQYYRVDGPADIIQAQIAMSFPLQSITDIAN